MRLIIFLASIFCTKFSFCQIGYTDLEKKFVTEKENNKKGLLTKDSIRILKNEFDDIKYVSKIEHTLFVKKNDRWAIYNISGKRLTPFEFENIAYTSGNDLKVFVKQYKGWAEIDQDGKLLTWYEFEDNEGIDDEGRMEDHIKINYLNSYVMNFDFYLNLASERKKNREADNDDKSFIYSTYTKFTLEGEKKGLLNGNKDTLTKAKFDEIYNEKQKGYFPVAINGKVGLIDTMGNQLIECLYDEVDNISNNRVFVKKNNKWALSNFSNKLLTNFIYDEVENFIDGVSRVSINKKIGFINSNGVQIIPCQFNNATSFGNGFSTVYYDKSQPINLGEGYQKVRGVEKSVGNVYVENTITTPVIINKSGKKIFIGSEGDKIIVAEKGFALISTRMYKAAGGNYQDYINVLIDTTGKIIIPPSKNYTVELKDNWIQVEDMKTKKVGTIDYKGNELLKPNFFWVSPLIFNNDQYAKLYFDFNNYIYIDKNCKCVEFEGIKCPDKE